MIKKGFQAMTTFVKDVKTEVLKVTFPTKNETIGATTVVIIFTIIFSIFLAVIDAILVRLLRLAV